MPANEETTPVTQIIYLALQTQPRTDLNDSGLWKEALDICERGAPGCARIYWGRSLECPEYGQLHIVRETYEQHQQFVRSEAFAKFVSLVGKLTGGKTTAQPLIRHARLKAWSPSAQALAHGAPFTGTAIYLDTTPAWDEGAWPLWTHIVRHIDGCLGGAEGELLEPVETIPGPLGRNGTRKQFGRCSIVYVGWETVEKHDAYHHTDHFREHSVVLRKGNSGFAEYGHVVFEGSRENLDQKSIDGARL